MRESEKAEEQLIDELAEMRQRIAELEALESERDEAQETLQHRNRNLTFLNQVSLELVTTPDLSQVLERLLQAAVEIAGAEGSSVWVWDEDRAGELVCRAILINDQYSSPHDFRLRPGDGIAGWVAQRGQSVSVPNAQGDPRFFPGIDQKTGFHTTSLLAVPLKIRDNINGVIEVVNKRGSAEGFDTDDCALIEMLAASAAIAIDNARLIKALRQYGMELETRNQELDAFAHSVAHDLKNPLGRVIGFAELLERDYATLPHEDLRQCLHIIAQTGRKMSSIINELLLLAGVRKMEQLELIPLDMNSIVTEALGRLSELIETYEANMILPNSWPVAMGYGPWVEEVWVNYISNAISYGGRPPRVELGATELGDGTIRFWICDNGRGLTAEEQARLFTRFERFDRVRAKGHGLGLSIVRRIMEKLGGEFGVESQVGQGSVFSFTLPAVTQ